MSIYNVIETSTGKPVYQYEADAPIEWRFMEFDTHTHIEVTTEGSEEPVTSSTVYGGVRKLTKLQWRKLLKPQEEVLLDRIRSKFEDMPYADGVKDMIRVFCNRYSEATLMDLDDPNQRAGLMLLASLAILENEDRVGEILNG